MVANREVSFPGASYALVVRRHFFDTRYFSSIETAEQAYWLGFIAADGGITNTKKTKALDLTLKASDHLHVAKLCTAIGYDQGTTTTPTKSHGRCTPPTLL